MEDLLRKVIDEANRITKEQDFEFEIKMKDGHSSTRMKNANRMSLVYIMDCVFDAIEEMEEEPYEVFSSAMALHSLKEHGKEKYEPNKRN